MSHSDDYLAGWKAARRHAQSSGSVPPVPPGYTAPTEAKPKVKPKAKAKPKAKPAAAEDQSLADEEEG